MNAFAGQVVHQRGNGFLRSRVSDIAHYGYSFETHVCHRAAGQAVPGKRLFQ